jgi:hypothetical protein
VSTKVLTMIRRLRKELENDSVKIEKSFLRNRQRLIERRRQNKADMKALHKLCGHPNLVTGEQHGCATYDCPDCGYSALVVPSDKAPRRGRRFKKKEN